MSEPLTRAQVEHIAAQLSESTRVLSFPCSQVIAGWLLTDADLRAQLTAMTKAHDTLADQVALDTARIITVVQQYTEAQQEVARLTQIVRDEPELPGEMPLEIYELVKNDREAIAEFARIVVRETKKNILALAGTKEGI